MLAKPYYNYITQKWYMAFIKFLSIIYFHYLTGFIYKSYKMFK